jgi:hypothetical protein
VSLVSLFLGFNGQSLSVWVISIGIVPIASEGTEHGRESISLYQVSVLMGGYSFVYEKQYMALK